MEQKHNEMERMTFEPRDEGRRPPLREGDYEENGQIYCGKCRTPRTKTVEVFGSPRQVVTQCRCQRLAQLDLRQKQLREEFELLMERQQMTDRISDLSYRSYRFESDDHLDDKSCEICERYVEQWEQMRKHNMGVLLYGTVGSGKTYRAGCIVNDLYKKLVSGTVTSFPRLLNLLQDCPDRQGLLDQLNWYECLVIDDLGAERDSPYALEQVYNIIDSRGKSGKPLIVTTNLTLQELKTPKNLDYARIYDRVLELCPITLKMTGESRRAERAKAKRELARQILMVS